MRGWGGRAYLTDSKISPRIAAVSVKQRFHHPIPRQTKLSEQNCLVFFFLFFFGGGGGGMRGSLSVFFTLLSFGTTVR